MKISKNAMNMIGYKIYGCIQSIYAKLGNQTAIHENRLDKKEQYQQEQLQIQLQSRKAIHKCEYRMRQKKRQSEGERMRERVRQRDRQAERKREEKRGREGALDRNRSTHKR